MDPPRNMMEPEGNERVNNLQKVNTRGWKDFRVTVGLLSIFFFLQSIELILQLL